MKRILLAAFLIFAPAIGVAQSVAPATVTQPVVSPAVTQNTVSTTGPVKSETTISVGTFASQILQWIMVAFGPVIGSMIVWVLVRVLNKLGIQATEALRARLTEIVTNGLNSDAAKIEQQLAGKGQIEIKNAIVQSAVAYTQAHGAETIKALGLDPNSGAAVEAIKARIETAIADPTVPTPAVLSTDAPKTVQK